MQHRAGDKTYEVFGIFQKFLEIAGSESSEIRKGQLLNARGKPATIEDLAFILSMSIESIDFALQVLLDEQVAWVKEVPNDEFQKFQENQESKKQPKTASESQGFPEIPGKSGALYNETKRNETEQNETERNETLLENPGGLQNSQTGNNGDEVNFGDFKSNSFSLRFDSALGQILNARSKSDRSAIRNLGNWLNLQVLAKRFDESIFRRVADMAKESKNGRNPMALFFSRLDEEIGYRARVVKAKE
ncbi:MAG TPA: hypothetical protein VMY06_14735 [Sedimentisphaerales bacterium]|nr:hypothetical protein [Sedimentisphaerales bacterium]HUU15602.1 hypothetical protein [Sedimentisphaerales bacterium]